MKNLTREQLIERIRFLESRVSDLESTILKNTEPNESVKAEKIYEVIFRLSPAAIGITRLEDGVIYDASDSYCEVTGYTREELLGNTTIGLKFWLDPRDRDSVRDLLKRYGYYRNVELNFRKKDGTVYTVLQSAEVVNLGEKHYIIATHLDISDIRKTTKELMHKNDELDILNDKLRLINDELRKSKEAMRENYEKTRSMENKHQSLFNKKPGLDEINHILARSRNLALILDSIRDGIIITDNGGSIKMLNRQAEMMTGWPCDEAAGAQLSTIFVTRLNSDPNTITTIDEIENHASEATSLLTMRDGSVIPIIFSRIPITTDINEKIGTIIIMRHTDAPHPDGKNQA